MITTDSLNSFINWIQQFQFETLCNEDDVETKFVIPFFRALGYPDKYRRGKYPIASYQPGKPGRKPEIDEAYFATEDIDRQNNDTSLLVVEAKEPNKANLDEDIKQALFYSYNIEAPFIVVTNGIRLIVQKRQRFRGEEVLFDDDVSKLRDPKVATSLYGQLNFDVVIAFKQYSSSDEKHTQFSQFNSAMQRYPDLMEILRKGDFPSFSERVDTHLVIVKPKVAIACQLPKAFDEGSCQIEFSNITLRGLSIQLSHQDILGKLVTGLNTLPDSQARHFLKQVHNNAYEVNLGNANIILQEDEAIELCECIDVVCKEYKDAIVKTERLLGTWEFSPMRTDDIYGFHIFSVELSLWGLLRKFTQKIGPSKYKADWPVFEPTMISIRASSRGMTHMYIYPKLDIDPWTSLPSDYVHLLYVISPLELSWIESLMHVPWHQTVGLHGIWTAPHSKRWLLENLIPEACNYYSKECQSDLCYPDIKDEYKPRRSVLEVEKPEELSTYLCAVQEWLGLYQLKISTSLLQPYYTAFINLIRGANFSVLQKTIDYIAENLSAIDSRIEESLGIHRSIKRSYKHQWTQQDILDNLMRHSERIMSSDYEDSHNADLMSRVFIAVIENGGINNCTQAELNAAKRVLLPLWEQQCFETRYVFPNQK